MIRPVLRLYADALVVLGEDDVALDDVLQLADIALPAVVHAGLHGAVGEAEGFLTVSVVKARDEMLR